jgi:hypothetical protein
MPNQELQRNTRGADARPSTVPETQKPNQTEITIPSAVYRWIQV